MNLSIFTSRTGWGRLIRLYILWVVAIGCVLGAVIITLDPYDSGRFALFGAHGVPHFGQRLADVSLGRQPQFDAAIIGNSTMQLIEPAHLAVKGIHAVSLTIPGTGPLEQISIARWFVRHHKAPRMIVIGLDRRWCELARAPDLTHPFPFWLYGNDTGDYIVNMMSYQGLEHASRKIGLMLGKAKPLPADGYNNYQAAFVWDRAGFRKRLKEPDQEEGDIIGAPPYEFNAAPLLRDFLKSLPRATAVILAMPPEFRPEVDRKALRQHQACEKSYAALAAARPHTQLVDFLADADLTTQEDDYWDRRHYRSRIAGVMEEGIAEGYDRAEGG